MKLDYSTDPATRDILLTGRVSETELMSERVVQAIAEETVRKIADVLVLERGADIMSRIDVNAIANMVIAKAAASISAQLSEKLK